MGEGGPRGTGRVVFALLTSIVGSVGFATAYQLDAGTQWLGLSFAVALGGLGAGLVWWSHRLMPREDEEEEREVLVPPPEEKVRTAATFERGRRGIERRGVLGALLAAASGALGLGGLSLVRSLGPAPRTAYHRTGWTDGVHLVDAEGRRVDAGALKAGGILTVFPEGPQSRADDQVVLLRVPLADLRLPAGREGWTPEGYIAYSKVCTHAGCPVGLYQNVGYLLLCPCHQATFDVSRGAIPVFGPAPRQLPQLPLRIGEDGALVAAGDFSGPVGPDRWRISEDEELEEDDVSSGEAGGAT